jgi:signal transduction histidine kinase
LKNEAGENHQVIEVRRDITERKLLEANLAHSERLVSMGLLASGLAHEINNPLASISTFVEGLKRKLPSRKDATGDDLAGLGQSLGLILKEIERAKDVTQRLLILAQKDEPGRSLVNLNESLLETVSLVRYEGSRKGIRLEVELDPEIPTLKLSESQVRQVFLNLLLNSLQAGHPGGQVQCRTWHEDGRAFVSVRDDGNGIETADLIKIFDPFFSKKPSGQSTGLGLFISKSIVSSMGGAITVESSSGNGAKFTVWFPVQS